MIKYVGPACQSCSHSPEGTLPSNKKSDAHRAIFEGDAGARDCTCTCHDGWKIMHKVPLPERV